MYTNQDLNDGVKEGIFTVSSVQQFRRFMAELDNTHPVNEENFRLISGFNDIFVVIASGLLLVSVAWLGAAITPWVGALVFALSAWGLAEFFVLKRRMALPAIGLLLSFLGGVFALPMLFNGAGDHQPTELSLVVAGVLTSVAAYLHWLRFKVPITVAAGTVAGVACVLALILTMLPAAKPWLLSLVFVAGLLTFALAMVWDGADRQRLTRESDVGFWLHLVSAPMIVHPIFSSLGILQGVESVSSSLIVLLLYVVLGLISIAVDRRAIMVSALVYVVYAFSSLLDNYGMVSYSFALTGVSIGGTLLLLSAFWQGSRRGIFTFLPQAWQLHLPALKI